MAFASGALFEYYWRKSAGDSPSVSKRSIFSLARHRFEPADRRDDGLFLFQALKTLEEIGYALEDDWPYVLDAFPPNLDVVPAHVVESRFKLSSYKRVPPTAEAMKHALVHGPLLVGIEISNDWDDSPDGGLVPVPTRGSDAGGHCVVAVGYDDAKKAFRFRNSWGHEWGDHGHFWIPYSWATDVRHYWPQQLYAVS